jgi:N-acetylglutamate synthase-like GNAT family acetyltransferase
MQAQPSGDDPHGPSTPRNQGKGAGRRLAEALFEHLKESGVQTVHTTISWNDPHPVDYFRSLGFSRGEFVHLQKSLS